ncbi:hypothetical protein [Halomarina litorea]|uniref:hypothetical protein n=1 Tax=Halomarina litorea TaxID=2961595 RepID=UPI0020C4B334|nr:hypothetical protein [Halomarina sp. BCD28]
MHLPRAGTVALLLSAAGLYFLLDRTTLLDGLAGVLWALVGLAFGYQLRRQLRTRPVRAGDPDRLRAALDDRRPGPVVQTAAVFAAVGGAGVLTVAGDGFFRALERIGRALAALGALRDPSSLGLFDFWTVAAFLGGFALFACGLDQLLVGAYREALYRRHADETETPVRREAR